MCTVYGQNDLIILTFYLYAVSGLKIWRNDFKHYLRFQAKTFEETRVDSFEPRGMSETLDHPNIHNADQVKS
jgi:hypothetical protein